jgi:hypothetical protein
VAPPAQTLGSNGRRQQQVSGRVHIVFGRFWLEFAYNMLRVLAMK